LRAAQRDYEQGLLVGDARQTVSQYLAEWLDAKKPPEVRATTWMGYERMVRVHITPVIGRVKLSQLTPQHIQQVTTRAAARGLVSSSVSEVYGVLRQALKAAVRLGLLAQNPTDRTRRPRRERAEISPLTREEAQRFLRGVELHWLSPLFTLALSTGMRIGELLALKWREVDLDVGRLSVVASLRWEQGSAIYGEPKSRHSRRQIALSPDVVARLRDHQLGQRLQRAMVERQAGAVWQGDRFDAVFCGELGFPLREDRVRAQFYEALDACGIRRIRFHDLRHTCATLLLLQRVNPKIVSELLGHSSVSITLDIYSHVLPDMQQEAAQAIAVALGWRREGATTGD
jgi:integrase